MLKECTNHDVTIISELSRSQRASRCFLSQVGSFFVDSQIFIDSYRIFGEKVRIYNSMLSK